MKFVIIAALLGLACADVSHLTNTYLPPFHGSASSYTPQFSAPAVQNYHHEETQVIPQYQEQSFESTNVNRQYLAPAASAPAPVYHAPAPAPVYHAPAPVVHQEVAQTQFVPQVAPAPAPVYHAPAPVVHHEVAQTQFVPQVAPAPAPVYHAPAPQRVGRISTRPI
uniref:VM domain-containing protein n=1 Tax=Megaselia scalaris TaxID=36166 RepID=T1GAP2_MEGSC